MSVGDFETIVGSNFPQFVPPRETTAQVFDDVLESLPRPVHIIDNKMVRLALELPTEDEIEVFVHATTTTVPATGEEHTADDIAVEFTYEAEQFDVSADDLDIGSNPEKSAAAVEKLRWFLSSISADDPHHSWLNRMVSGLTADPMFRPFIVQELLEDPTVELDVSQQWVGGYQFNNGTHLAVAAEVPVGSYPPFPETIQPIELQIALTLRNHVHYVYQRFPDEEGDGFEEQLVWFPDVRQLTLSRYNDSDVPVAKGEPVLPQADVWVETELASERARPSDQLMRRMTKAMQKALRSGISGIGPLDAFDED